jgi:hypothetical protein
VAYVAAWLKSLFRKQLLGELQLSL